MLWSDVQGLDALVMQGCSHSMASDLRATQVTGSWDVVFVKAVLLPFYLRFRMFYQYSYPIQILDTSLVPLCPENFSEMLLTPSGSASAQRQKQSQIPGSYLYQILTQKLHTTL